MVCIPSPCQYIDNLRKLRETIGLYTAECSLMRRLSTPTAVGPVMSRASSYIRVDASRLSLS